MSPATVQLFMLFMMFVVIYLLILRPQAKRQKQRETMIKQVNKGDRIVTTSGFFGNVVGTKGDDVLIVKLAPDGLRVELVRSGVASVVSAETAKQVGFAAKEGEPESS